MHLLYEFQADLQTDYLSQVGLVGIRIVMLVVVIIVFGLLQEFFKVYFVLSLNLLLNVPLENAGNLIFTIIRVHYSVAF